MNQTFVEESLCENTNTNISIHQILYIIKIRWKVIALSALIGFFFAYMHTLNITPLYQSKALLQIIDTSQNSALISNSNEGLIGNKGASKTETEKALIHSRYILTPVVHALGVNTKATPIYFPKIGKYLATKYKKNHASLAPSKWNLSQYAWGNEEINVTNFSIPSDLYGVQFIITSKKNQQYELSLKGETVLIGTVGKQATSKNPKFENISLQLNKLIAHPNTQFTLVQSNPIGAINALSGQLKIENKTGDPNNKTLDTGILELSFSASNPMKAALILNTIIQTSQKTSKEQAAQQSKQSITFVNRKLPDIQKKLHDSETAYNRALSHLGTTSTEISSSLALNNLSVEETTLDQLQLNKSNLLDIFTEAHPTISNINQQIKKQEQLIQKTKQTIRQIPLSSQNTMSLARDAKVNEKIYSSMLSTSQELQLMQGGAVGSVQILNNATVPVQALPMHKKLILLSGLLAGALLSIIYCIGKFIFISSDISDPQLLENKLNLPVYTVIPYCLEHERHSKTARKLNQTLPTLYKTSPTKSTIESLRSLRTTLQMKLLESNNNLISIVGASPGIGKTFTALNLAHVLAETNQSILLIETDLRRGSLKRYIKHPQPQGLAEYLAGKHKIANTINTISKYLDIITCGIYPTNPTSLLTSPHYTELLEWAKKEYDIVLIDNAPILAVTDTSITSKTAGVNLFVAAIGKNSINEIKLAIKRFQQTDISIDGIVCNFTSKQMEEAASSQRTIYNYEYENE